MSYHHKKKNNEESELEEIKKGFEMFDVNGTGKIVPIEVKEAMDSMNMKEKNPFIYEVIESLCAEKDYRNNDNGISIDDLVNYVYEKVNDNETNLGLHQLFDALKDPESETISMHTFIKLAKEYGDDDGMSEEELRYLLEKTQLGGDELTFDEFYTIMKGGGSSSSKSNVSMRSSEPYNKKKQSPLSNITSQDMNNSKNENNENNIINENNENDNVNYNEEEININVGGTGSPEKAPDTTNKEEYSYKKQKIIGGIKPNSSNINNNVNNNNVMDLDSFEKGLNQIKIDNEEDKKREKEENEVKEVTEVKVVKEVNEVKEDKPIRKYNRFRRYEVTNNNNNNDNNNNKVVVEEKTTVTKNVYRTRRPVNMSNNEDKKIEKKNENNESKDVEIHRRYHRRYRENKTSTNVDQ